ACREMQRASAIAAVVRCLEDHRGIATCCDLMRITAVVARDGLPVGEIADGRDRDVQAPSPGEDPVAGHLGPRIDDPSASHQTGERLPRGWRGIALAVRVV